MKKFTIFSKFLKSDFKNIIFRGYAPCRIIRKVSREEEKRNNTLLWILAVIGAVAAVAAIAYAVYRYMTPDYLEDFEDDFDDDFEDDFFEDEEEEEKDKSGEKPNVAAEEDFAE